MTSPTAWAERTVVNDAPALFDKAAELKADLLRRISETNQRCMALLYGNRCPDYELMRERHREIVACEAELKALRAELANY